MSLRRRRARISLGRPVLVALAAAAVLTACGGGDTATTTESEAPTATAEATTAAETTAAPAVDTAAFDAAAAQVAEATNALTAIRSACMAADNVSTCLQERVGEMTAVEEALATALVAAGPEATAAGVSPDLCAASLEAITGKLPAEREALYGWYGLSPDGSLAIDETGSFSDPGARYYTLAVQQFASDPGYMVGLALGDCRLAAKPDAPNAQLLNAALAYVYGVIRARNAIGYGGWGLSACLGRGGAERASCLDSMAGTEDLEESLGKMNAGFSDLSAAPGYADLSSTCKSSFEAAHTQLDATGADLKALYGDVAAASTDDAFSAAYDATLPIALVADPSQEDEVTLDESTVFSCIEEIAAQGA